MCTDDSYAHRRSYGNKAMAELSEMQSTNKKEVGFFGVREGRGRRSCKVVAVHPEMDTEIRDPTVSQRLKH